jgi:hypothetical protein
MLGPGILARSMSRATVRGNGDTAWQYHSRSDIHSKIACWALMFDLLNRCDVLRSAAEKGKIGFGINHVMVGPINKTLDLVITWDAQARPASRRFSDLVPVYGIELTDAEAALLHDLPDVPEVSSDQPSEVAVALEAKACMTEHVKSLPRLHAEILATGYLAKRAVRDCITVSYSLVNAATSFVSPSGAGSKVNRHTQPSDARRVVEMLSTAIPKRGDSNDYGYDAIGVTAIECHNDGSPVKVVEDPRIAPGPQDHVHYARMVSSLCSLFRARFGKS